MKQRIPHSAFRTPQVTTTELPWKGLKLPAAGGSASRRRHDDGASLEGIETAVQHGFDLRREVTTTELPWKGLKLMLVGTWGRTPPSHDDGASLEGIETPRPAH